MSDEKSQQEPTMEEILASIRRIISENDDGDATAAPAAAAAAAPAAAAAKPEPKPEPKSEPKPEPKPAPVEEEDVLELTDVVAEEPAKNYNGADLVVDDLPEPQPEPQPEPKPEPVAEPAPAPVTPAPPQIGDDRLVSDPVAAASTAALGVLAQALNRDNATTGNIVLGSGNTLEDLIKDMIRPMLREWLDQNLAQLVERLVKREIERMVRRAEDL